MNLHFSFLALGMQDKQHTPMEEEDEEDMFEFYIARLAKETAVSQVKGQVEDLDKLTQGQRRKLSAQAKQAGDEAYIRSLEDTVVTCEMEKECSKAILDGLIRERKRDEMLERQRQEQVHGHGHMQKQVMMEDALFNIGNGHSNSTTGSNTSSSYEQASHLILPFEDIFPSGNSNSDTSGRRGNRKGSGDFLGLPIPPSAF